MRTAHPLGRRQLARLLEPGESSGQKSMKGPSMASTAQVAALVLRQPGELGVETFPRPVVQDDTALLRVELVGICGTDAKTYAGAMPYPTPLVLGHEIVGTIEEAGSRFLSDKSVSVGDRVTVAARVPCWSCSACQGGNFRGCTRPAGYGTWTRADEPPHLWGGMAEFMHLAPGSIVRAVPHSVSPAAALMAQTVVANGFEWVQRVGELVPGETVVIQGCGPQGLGAAVVAVASGAEHVVVTGLSRDIRRLKLAEQAGARTIVADVEDPVSAVADLTSGRMAQLVVNVTGSAATITESLRLAARRGRIALAGLAGEGVEASLPVDEIVWRELSIRGCYIKGVEALDLASELLRRDPSWEPFLRSLVTDVVGLEDVEERLVAFGSRAQGDSQPVKLAVDPWLQRNHKVLSHPPQDQSGVAHREDLDFVSREPAVE